MELMKHTIGLQKIHIWIAMFLAAMVLSLPDSLNMEERGTISHPDTAVTGVQAAGTIIMPHAQPVADEVCLQNLSAMDTPILPLTASP